jgi:hypothetical protein
MKKYLLFILLICFAANFASAQTKLTKKSGAYAGLGYSFLIYTNSDVSDIYPSFDFRTGSFNTEINPYIGMKLSDAVSLEFSPSFIYSKSGGSKGFYYQSTSNTNYYYLPSPAYIFAIPLNLKMKLFPFSKSGSLISKGIFLGVSAGAMFIREEYDNQIYSNESMNNIINIRNVSNTQWAPNSIFSIGYSSDQQFSYGFELGYRFVPLALKRDYPLATSLASNMNAVVLNIRIGINF